MRTKLWLICLPLFFSLSTAKAVELVVWRPSPLSAPLILPVPKGLTPSAAAVAYLEAARHPDNRVVFNEGVPDLRTENFTVLDSSDIERRALLIGNMGTDLLPASERIARFADPLALQGQKSYVLPPMADLHVPSPERAELRRKIAAQFFFLVSMGGDDVDPAHYGDKVRGSLDFHYERDRFEIELIRDFISTARGFILGVCRGSQIANIALGAKMIQDVPTEFGHRISHGDNWHGINLKPTSHGLLKRMVGGLRAIVNSYHHQALHSPVEHLVDVAAVGDDGLIEATELKNGRGLFLQFHPEYMEGMALGTQIFRGVVQQKDAITPRSCARIFGN